MNSHGTYVGCDLPPEKRRLDGRTESERLIGQCGWFSANGVREQAALMLFFILTSDIIMITANMRASTISTDQG